MPLESPLAPLHERHGAVFAEDQGRRLPLRFGDPLREYEAVRSHAGIFDLCHRAVVRFRGSDRASYLQGMLSNDVARLTPGKGMHAAVLDVQGKILSDVRVFCAEGFLLLDLWDFRREPILAHLQRYLVAEDVEIDDLADRCGILSIQGPRARALVERLLGPEAPPSGMLDHRLSRLGNSQVLVIRSTHTGEDGFDLVVDRADLPEAAARIEEAAAPLAARWAGAEALDVLRLEAGIPRYGVDMNEDNLLLETGLDHAVSFRKGCYLGQEVVERIHSRGHVNRKLAGLILEGTAAAHRGDPVSLSGKEIGRITSSRYSPALKRAIALAYLHRDVLAPRLAVSVGREGGAIPATTSNLPFIPLPASLETPPELS